MSDAADLLYTHLGSIPSEKFGHINLLPFAVESDQVNELKRDVAEGIVTLFKNSGYPMDLDRPVDQAVGNVITVSCRLCSTTLFELSVQAGYASVPAAAFFHGLANMSPDCPHERLTLNDQRRKIEEAVVAEAESRSQG